MYIEPWYFFLFLGTLGLYLLLSAPVSGEERAVKRERRQKSRDEWAAWKLQRQADRRRVFGSHPLLYSALAWASPVLVLGLIALLH